jgi:hypothetical protein
MLDLGRREFITLLGGATWSERSGHTAGIAGEAARRTRQAHWRIYSAGH